MDKTTTRLAVYDVNAWVAPFVREFVEPEGSQWPTFWPVQSQPETPIPYIRYNTSTNTADVWWKRADTVSYGIYDGSIDNSDKIFTIMVDLMSREDASAYDLNMWLRNREEEEDIDRQFQFYTFSYEGGGMIAPQGEEGGTYPRVFSFRYEYSVLKGRGIR